MNVKDKVVTITGASGGIGRPLVFEFLRHGAFVHALDIDDNALADMQTKATNYGTRLKCWHVDVTKQADIDRYCNKAIGTKTYPEILINNAGMSFPESFTQTKATVFDKIMKVNFDGTIKMTRALLPTMEERGFGVITNIASIAGHMPSAYFTSYAASKHAIVGFTRSLQLELKINNSPVHVLMVSPGFVDTQIMRTNSNIILPDSLGKAAAKPKDVARAIFKATVSLKEESFPTINGKVMLNIFKHAPKSLFNWAALSVARNSKK